MSLITDLRNNVTIRDHLADIVVTVTFPTAVISRFENDLCTWTERLGVEGGIVTHQADGTTEEKYRFKPDQAGDAVSSVDEFLVAFDKAMQCADKAAGKKFSVKIEVTLGETMQGIVGELGDRRD